MPNHLNINKKQLKTRVDKLPEIKLKAVDKTNLETIWNNLVKRHHYLGFKKMVGARVKYLAFSGNRIIGCIGYRAASLHLGPRDEFIGWSYKQRKKHLRHIANNSRFLILPWIDVKNLGSHLLAKSIDNLQKDWQQKYGKQLLLVETFINPEHFQGTVYQAANWIKLGQTKGYTKDGSNYVYHGNRKDIYVYPVVSNFRKIIGCKKGKTKNLPSSSPSPSSRCLHIDKDKTKGEKFKMLIQDNNWHPELLEQAGLNEDNLEQLADMLMDFHKYFNPSFSRVEHFKYGLVYLKGLISNLPRKTIESIALEYFGPKGVRNLQRYLSQYKWDEDKMTDLHHIRVANNLSQPDGMFTIDSSENPKKGKESVGVARQYCGRLGKVENCQSGVFLGYTSSKGYCLLDRRLYLPQVWFSEDYEKRWEKCHIPDDIEFKTKPEIAQELIEKVQQKDILQGQWLGCDTFFGRDHEFIDNIGEHLTYLASIPSDTQVWRERPEVKVPPYKGVGRKPEKKQPLTPSRSVKEIVEDEDICWREVTIAQGAKGPIINEVARLRVIVARDDLPAQECWLILRKQADGSIKYYLCNASEDMLFEDMFKKLTMRWPVEQCFQEGKSELGMTDYELRTWEGWHRHMLYVFLAMLFLLEVRFKFKKNSKTNSNPASGQKVSECSS